MPGRKTPFGNGEFYHIFNRGNNRQNIFLKNRDYERFIQTLYYYQYSGPKIKFSQLTKSQIKSFNPSPKNKLVDIICFCLMPNHFHFLLRQQQDGGISKFLSQLENSYSKYFNTKYKRVGSLLQGAFKSVTIESDEQLIHLSRYIHLNPVVSDITENLDNYSWSSYNHYTSNNQIICSINEILNFFPSVEKYKEFLNDQIEYGKSLEIIKHKVFDEI